MPARSRYRCINPREPEAAGVCDRGGEVRRRSELLAEMRWAGNRLVPTGLLVCRYHLDTPHPHDRTLALGPDPVPVRDPRPLVGMPAPLVGLLGTDFFLGVTPLGGAGTSSTVDGDLTLDESSLA